MKLLILLQCCVLLCKLAAGHEGEGYLEGLGMENGKIADNQITASSERFNYKAVQARLRYKNKEGRPFGWQPKNSGPTEWLQVDLLDNYILTGVATQGCSPVYPSSQKPVFTVTKYQLEYSNDGKVFSTNDKLYKGNTDESTVVYHTLETPTKARYIRFRPKHWKNKICMRVELYGNIAKDCDSSPCLNGGTCFQDESGEEYNCKCTSGWKGDNCEQKFTACDSSPCLNGGTCFQDRCGVEEYICKCTSGWKGDNCEEKNITACDSSPCLNGGTCFQDESGEEYICKCTSGWKGDKCEQKFTACDSSPCLNGGTCFQDKNGIKEYICKCTSGWKGDNCEEKNITASTCKDIYEKSLSKGNTAYLLDVGSTKVPVYCHMTTYGLDACGGGGWTLVMKIDGSKHTFHYNSKLWSNKEDFNLPGGKTGLDTHETKLPTYWNTPFNKICLGMKIGQQFKSVVINHQAKSLYSLIADGKYRATSLGRNTWKKLIGSRASLQPYCNKEGFNAIDTKGSDCISGLQCSKARIGILGNEYNNCEKPDSRIGFGTAGYPDDSNTCGNEALHGADNGDQHIKAMGYILVQ